MAYVVTRLCRDCKDLSCIKVCPVDCILEHKPQDRESELPNQVFIDPGECIDCNMCVPECPWEAIFQDDDVPEPLTPDVALNALILERRSEFRVPEFVQKDTPTPDAVQENKERWGLPPRKALG